jgi:hypothetical protein
MSVTPNVPVKEVSIPVSSQPAYDAVIGLTDRFCQAHLTHGYQMLCRRLVCFTREWTKEKAMMRLRQTV